MLVCEKEPPLPRFHSPSLFSHQSQCLSCSPSESFRLGGHDQQGDPRGAGRAGAEGREGNMVTSLAFFRPDRTWLWQLAVLEGVVPLQDSGSKGWVCVCLLKCVGGVGGHCDRSRVSCEQVKKPTLTEPPFAFVVSLLLASPQGTYEPGKRHWLKVKKDYLNEGAMADTADLVVLGAFYGQGSKGRWPLAPGMVLL